MLAKNHRLSKNGSFAYVYKNGKASHTRFLTLLSVLSSNDSVRVGFAVSNKIGKANVRNKVKRRMRAYAQTFIPSLIGCQCVFIAKVGIDTLSYEEICSSMDMLLKKEGLIKNEEEK